LNFYGISEYLEDLVVRIDAPLLDNLKMSFFHQFIPNTAQLAQFIDHTPKLKAHNEVHLFFYSSGIQLSLDSEVFEKGLGISYEVVDWQVSSVAQFCTSSLSQAFTAAVEHLCIYDDYASWQGDIQVEKNHWIELLRPFTSMKNLYLSWEIVPRIAPAMQELVAGTLPALQTLYLEDLGDLSPGPVQEAIGSFVSRRQFSGHPVAVFHWEKNLKKWPID
jgi:hypothetical protein